MLPMENKKSHERGYNLGLRVSKDLLDDRSTVDSR